MKEIKQIKLFIACPNDIIDEKKRIKLITEEINKTSGKQNSFSLELLNWDMDTYTQIGSDAQDVINLQIDNQYDILIGILWKKIGTPTKRGKSGTIEEINRAISNIEKEQLIFFKTTSVPINEIDTEQLSKVNTYKKELSQRGVLYKEYSSSEIFEQLIRINLTNLIIDQLLNSKNELPIYNKSDKYNDIINLITEVENKDIITLDIDILKLTDEFVTNTNAVGNSVGTITKLLNILSEDFKTSTTELNRIAHIKDNKLRLSRTYNIANNLAAQLNTFNENTNNELPKFSENLISMGKLYSEIILASSHYNFAKEADLKSNGQIFRDALHEAVEGCASVLKEIMKWPLVNSNLNNRQRETEITLKDLTKEMLEGLMLLYQLNIRMIDKSFIV